MLLILLANAAYSSVWRFPPSTYVEGALARPVAAVPGAVRVVWVIFDELSQAIAFQNRPKGLELPNFDRLRKQSFYATAGEAPGRSTMVSMPALITGLPVLASQPAPVPRG